MRAYSLSGMARPALVGSMQTKRASQAQAGDQADCPELAFSLIAVAISKVSSSP